MDTIVSQNSVLDLDLFQNADVTCINVANDEDILDLLKNTDDDTTYILIDTTDTLDPESIKKQITNNNIKNKYKEFINKPDNHHIRYVQNDENQNNNDQIEENEQSNERENNENEQNENQNEGNENNTRSRKRRRNVVDWKQSIRKRRRQAGKDYVNTKGRAVEKKKIKEMSCKENCKYKCRQKISTNERKEIFNSFWSLNDSGKNVFYSRTVIKQDKRRNRSSKEISRKKYSYKYHFIIESVKIQVCKQFYLRTLDISAKRLQWFFQKKDPEYEDKRGKNTKFKIPEQARQRIRDHIKSFPTIESHYCRASSSREYLDPNLSMSKMYELYREKCDVRNITPEKLHVYRHIFNNEFNLGFHVPKKDRCDICENFKACSNNENLTNEIKTKYEIHIQNKNSAKTERDRDRNSNEATVCFDMENVISCPRANISNFFYKRKLSIYNLTAHLSLNKHAYNAIWPETMAGRGGHEIASALLVILRNIFEEFPNIEKLNLWSDSCVPQNRNSFMLTALMHFLTESPTLTTIDQKFSEAGHSTIQEVDNIHSHVEKALGRNEIFSPVSCMRVLTNVRKRGMKIIQMKPSDFLNLQKSSLSFSFSAVPFTKLSHIHICSDTPSHIKFKTSHAEESYTEVSIRKETRKGTLRKPIHPKLVPLGYVPKLSQEKINDIKSMFKYMPTIDKTYLENVLK